MEQSSTQVLESYIAAFAKFRAHQLEQFRVKVRRKRAAELRLLLSNPQTVSLKIFNEEVWRIERGTFVRGSGSGKPWTIFTSDTVKRQGLTPAEIKFLDQALDEGKLVLHGNYCWGTGTRIYAPMLKDDVEKEKNLRHAMSILTTSGLTPLEKAKQMIDQVYGFGDNTATGLVMVFHPNEFAHYNTETKPPVEKLGYRVRTLEAFEQAVQEIKERLGAEDFIELDRFLHVYNRPESLFKPDE